MNQEPRLYALGELWQEENEVSGALVCPGCGEHVFSGGWDGELTSFESVCGECGGSLLYFNTVVETDEYYRENGSASVEELREFLTSYWDAKLAAGIVTERETGYESVNGFVEPVIEEVDETEMYADEYQYRAGQFGWDWEPPEEVVE